MTDRTATPPAAGTPAGAAPGGAAPAHAQRLNASAVDPAAYRAMFGLAGYVHASGLEPSLLEPVKLRASYLNGCAYCVDMHARDARLAGESEQRLYAVPVWRETPFFTPRERAALAWTEAVTDVARTGVPDELYAATREQFGEQELVALTMTVVSINGWNRLAIGFRAPVGSYVAGSAGRTAAHSAPSALPSGA